MSPSTSSFLLYTQRSSLASFIPPHRALCVKQNNQHEIILGEKSHTRLLKPRAARWAVIARATMTAICSSVAQTPRSNSRPSYRATKLWISLKRIVSKESSLKKPGHVLSRPRVEPHLCFIYQLQPPTSEPLTRYFEHLHRKSGTRLADFLRYALRKAGHSLSVRGDDG